MNITSLVLLSMLILSVITFMTTSKTKEEER